MYTIYVNNELFCKSSIEDLAVINPVITQEANKAGTFSFTIPPNHPKYSLIRKRLDLIEVYRDDELLFEGVCTEDGTDFFNQRRIDCEGSLTFLNDSTLRPAHRQGLTVRQLLTAYISEHNAAVEEMKQFTVGIVTVTDPNNYITCYTNYNSTMTEIKEDLVDDLGGYLRVRKQNGTRYLDYLAESPRQNEQEIKLGSNLLDFSKTHDMAEVATVLIPLGAKLAESSIEGLDERLTIETAAADTMHPSGADYVESTGAIATYGRIEKVVTWDDVTTASSLLTKGEAYLQDVQFENLVLEVKAFDLGLTDSEFQKFRLLDTVRVVSAPHGLDREFVITEMTINLNAPESDSITLGKTVKMSMSAKSTKASAEIKKLADGIVNRAMMQDAIDNATALITGADGGYVIIEKNADGQPTEIKIQNALNNPTKIWRWNVNGLGYSNDGGQTYGLAMTMDGAIVADYITTGILRSLQINNGNGAFTVDTSGKMTATAGTIAGFNINANSNRFEVYSDLNVLSGYLQGNKDGEDTGLSIWGRSGIDVRAQYGVSIQSAEISLGAYSSGNTSVSVGGPITSTGLITGSGFKVSGHEGKVGDVTTKTNSSAVTLTTGTWTNSQCYVNVQPGVFEFHVRATFAAAAGKRRGVRLYNALTASVISDSTLLAAGPATSQTITLKASTPVEITESCNVYLQVYQDTGDYLDVTSSNVRCVRYR